MTKIKMKTRLLMKRSFDAGLDQSSLGGGSDLCPGRDGELCEATRCSIQFEVRSCALLIFFYLSYYFFFYSQMYVSSIEDNLLLFLQDEMCFPQRCLFAQSWQPAI